MPKVGDINNPKGKGGFSDNPQNRSNGTWSKDTSISYWQNYLIRLSLEDFDNFQPQSLASLIAHTNVKKAIEELAERKELQDRTEGKASQSTDITTNGKEITATIIEWGGNKIQV